MNYEITSNIKGLLGKRNKYGIEGNISKSKLEEKKFIVPPMEQQEQFSDFIKQVDKSKSVISKSIEETQRLFDSLMQQYFE